MSRITPPAPVDYSGMHRGIVALLEAARHATARSVNSLMTARDREIGRRIVEFEQGGQLCGRRPDAHVPDPPVCLVLCTGKGSNGAHYALDGLPNKVTAAEHQAVLPDARLLKAELEKTRRELEARRMGHGAVGADE